MKISIFIGTILMTFVIYASEIAYVEHIKGDLFLRSFNDSIGIDRGYIVSESDTLKTGFYSGALLRYAENTAELLMGNSTALTLRSEPFNQFADNIIMLSEGNMFISVVSGQFSVHTNSGVGIFLPGFYYAGVRGDTMEIRCYQGEADVQNRMGNIIINDNQICESVIGQNPYRMPLEETVIWESVRKSLSDVIVVEFVNGNGEKKFLEIVIE